jgi:hypothetical protein
MSVSPEDGQGEDEVWSIHPDLLTLHLQNFNYVELQRAQCMPQNQEHCRNLSMKLPVLRFNQQQYKKYAALFSTTVNNSLVMVVVILKICDFKVINTPMD